LSGDSRRLPRTNDPIIWSPNQDESSNLDEIVLELGRVGIPHTIVNLSQEIGMIQKEGDMMRLFGEEKEIKSNQIIKILE